MSLSQTLANLLAQHAYEEGDFLLSSGERSSFYLDAKRVTYRPEGVALVGEAVLGICREFRVEAVGGLTMGADAIVVSTVCASVSSGELLPGFVVRKKAKEHGKEQLIEGVSPAGKRVAIVDDVITKGGSVLMAVQAATDAGAQVVVVIGLVDRQQGGAETIEEQARVPFRAICTLAQIRELAVIGSSA